MSLLTSYTFRHKEVGFSTMMKRFRRQVCYLLPLLIFALAAVSSSSTAFSSPSNASTRADQRQQTVQATNRGRGPHHNDFSATTGIHAALTGSLSGGGEPGSIAVKVKSFAKKNLLIVGMVGAVVLARLFPEVRQHTLHAF